MSNDSAKPQVVVESNLQPQRARLGDLLSLTVRITPPPQTTLEITSPPKAWGTFEVYSSSTVTGFNGNPYAQELQAQLQNFTTGQQTLSGVEFILHDSNGHTQHAAVPALQVTIEEVPAGPKDKGDIRGIKGVIGPVAWSPWWWVLLALAVGGIAFGLWYRRQKKLQGPPPPPPEPADTVALRKLQELIAGGLLESDQLKEFYIGLSDAIRTYIENGFQCPALERTTSELLRDLRKQGKFDSPMLLQIKILLEACDLVKFAKFRPEAGEALKEHASAVQIVEKTRVLLKTDSEDIHASR